MIKGLVTSQREAVIRVAVIGAGGWIHEVDAVIDTGFDGWLSLSSSQIANLGLPFRSRGRAMLADGSEQLVDMHEGRVIWDDETIRIVVDAAETAPLIGMSLMHGFRLTADIVEGGEVTIERL